MLEDDSSRKGWEHEFGVSTWVLTFLWFKLQSHWSRVKYECWVRWNQELITWGMLILNGLGRESSSPHWEGNITCWCPGLCTGILELRPTVRATYFVAPEFNDVKFEVHWMTNPNLGRQSTKSSPTASVILLWEFLLLNVRSVVILACNGYNASKGGLLDWLNPEAVIAHSKKRGGLESADSTCEFNHFTSFDHLFIFMAPTKGVKNIGYCSSLIWNWIVIKMQLSHQNHRKNARTMSRFWARESLRAAL